MKRWMVGIIIAMLVASFMFVFFQNGRSVSDSGPDYDLQDAAISDELEQQKKPAEDSKTDPLKVESIPEKESGPIGELVRSIGIQELNGNDTNRLGFYDNVRQHERTFRYNWYHIRIIMEVGREHLEQVETQLSQIRVEGKAQYEIQIRDELPKADFIRIYIDVTDIDGEFLVVSDGLPKITFKPMEIPFAYSLEEESIQGPYFSFYRESQAIDLLLLGPEEDHAVFVFSQDVDPRFAEIELYGDAEGEWLDARNYQISWKPQPESQYIQVYFKGVYSLDGSTITQQRTTGIRIVPERSWAVYPSGEKIGFSEYDRFYDFLLFSPNKKRYLGLFDRNAAQFDGGGIFHDIFLEELGKEPVQVTNRNVAQFSLNNPIFWLNDDEFLYWNSKQLFHFNADTLQETILLETYDRDTWTIDDVFFDAYDSAAYVSTSYYGGEEQNTRIREFLYYDMNTGELEELKSDHMFNQLTQVNDGIRHYFVREEGGYFVSYEQGIPYTVFLGRDGAFEKSTGELLHIVGDSLVIRRVEIKDGKQQQEFVLIREDQEIPVPAPPGNVRVFGEYIITAAYAEGGKAYHVYDVDANRWKPLNEIPPSVELHYQTIDSLYRGNH